MATRSSGAITTKVITMTALAGSMALSIHASAAQAVLEEVVVTARKRAETLQDVPISVTSMGQETMERFVANDLPDVAEMLPNVTIQYGSRTGGLNIRGVSSGGDTGFDQSVGLVIDDVYYGRNRWVQQGFVDMAQVDVLRGPQGVYIGKNTTAGALVIRTADPTAEFESHVKAGYEVEAKETFIEGVVSGPLTETLGARLAVRALDMDGWMKNLHTGKSSPEREEYYGRLTLKWSPTDTFTNTFKASYSEIDRGDVTQSQLFVCPQGAPQPAFGVVPSTGTECRLDDKFSIANDAPGDFGRGPYWDFESYTLSNTATWQVGAYSITSVTGFNHYRTEWLDNFDYSTADQIKAYELEETDTFSQEIRLITEWDGPINLLVGGYYEKSDFEYLQSSQLFNQTFFDLLGLPISSRDPVTGREFTWQHDNYQDGRSWALFAEVTWEMTDTLELAVGGRYSDEWKKSQAYNSYLNPAHMAFSPMSTEVYRDTFKDDNLSPQVILSWTPIDSLMLWGSYKEGFKAGGFAHGSNLNAGFTIDDLIFDSEEVKGFEAGLKATLLNGAMHLNLAVYDYEYTDLQVTLFNSDNPSFTVGNAGENLTRGFEFEGDWRVVPDVVLRATVAYNDAEVKDFRSSCYSGQTIEEGCDGDFNPATGRFMTQSLDGKPLPHAPKWTVGTGVVWDYIFPNQMRLTTDLRVLYSDDYRTAASTRPEFGQDAYTRVDLALILAGASDNWELGLFSRNLTDEKILMSTTDRPGSGGPSGLPASAPGAGVHADAVGVLQRGREYGATFTYRFQ